MQNGADVKSCQELTATQRGKHLQLLVELVSPTPGERWILDDLNNCVSVSLPANRIWCLCYCQVKGKQSHTKKRKQTFKPSKNLLKFSQTPWWETCTPINILPPVQIELPFQIFQKGVNTANCRLDNWMSLSVRPDWRYGIQIDH